MLLCAVVVECASRLECRSGLHLPGSSGMVCGWLLFMRRRGWEAHPVPTRPSTVSCPCKEAGRSLPASLPFLLARTLGQKSWSCKSWERKLDSAHGSHTSLGLAPSVCGNLHLESYLACWAHPSQFSSTNEPHAY